MNYFKADPELEMKIARSIIQFIKINKNLEKVLSDQKFVADKMSLSFYTNLLSSKNAIDEFIYDLCEKLNCSTNELESLITKTGNIFEISCEEIKKLLDFLSKKSINWNHILIGLAGATAASITLVSLGTATPIAIGLAAIGVGIATTLISCEISNLLDNLNNKISPTRIQNIKSAINLYAQYQEYGKYPTLKKWLLNLKDCYKNFKQNQKWEPVKL